MNRKFSSRDLEAIRHIADNGSLTTTARLMHVSQPAVSQRLSAIQDRIGTDLFVRKDGRLWPTAAAERLASAAASVDSILKHAMDDVTELLQERNGRLRITTQCYTCYRWLSFVIRDLLELHPALSVDVVPEAIEDPYGAIARNEVDIAVVNQPDASATVTSFELFADEMYAVMRTDHPLAKRRFLNAENFADETLILYSGRRHAFVDQVLSPAGVVPGRLRQVRMTEAIVELARAGQGIAVLAGWVLNDLVSRNELTAVRILRGGYRRSWHAIQSDDCPANYAASFIQSVRKTANAIGTDNWRKKLEAV